MLRIIKSRQSIKTRKLTSKTKSLLIKFQIQILEGGGRNKVLVDAVPSCHYLAMREKESLSVW